MPAKAAYRFGAESSASIHDSARATFWVRAPSSSLAIHIKNASKHGRPEVHRSTVKGVMWFGRCPIQFASVRPESPESVACVVCLVRKPPRCEKRSAGRHGRMALSCDQSWSGIHAWLRQVTPPSFRLLLLLLAQFPRQVLL